MAEYYYYSPLPFSTPTDSSNLMIPNSHYPTSETLQFQPGTPCPNRQTITGGVSISPQSMTSLPSDLATSERSGQPVNDGPNINNIQATHEEGDDNRGKIIKVMISFRLFAATKNASSSSTNQPKKKTWGVVNSSNDVPIEVIVEVTSFEDFRALVISACNNDFTGAGPIISKGLSAWPQAIYWYGSIAHCPDFAKKDKVEIAQSCQYHEWLDMACDVGRSKVCLLLRMENPSKVAKQAQMEDLLAAQALRKAAIQKSGGKQKAVESDSGSEGSEELDPDDWDTINMYMNKIFDRHPLNAKYDQHNPVFLDPSDPTRYILLTTDACQTWAKAMADRKDGVSVTSPPSSLRYISLSSTKRSRLSDASGSTSSPTNINSSSLQLLVDLLAAKGSTIQPNRIRDREYTLDILLSNGFHSHKVFKSSGLARSDVKALGLTLGVVTMLFDNVAKYEHALACGEN